MKQFRTTITARLFGHQKRTQDNNVMHAKPDLRVFLKWMIAGSGSVITDVITPWQFTNTKALTKNRTRTGDCNRTITTLLFARRLWICRVLGWRVRVRIFARQEGSVVSRCSSRDHCWNSRWGGVRWRYRLWVGLQHAATLGECNSVAAT